MLVIILVQDFYLKGMYLAIGPKQNASLGKKAWFSGNTCLIKIISHGILILIEGSKVQYIKKWIILVIRLTKYEDFYTKCVYEGGSIIPCNHLYSLHMGVFIQRWQFLHQVWTFIFHALQHGQCCTLGCTTALA